MRRAGIMPRRRLAVFLFCFGVLHTPGNAAVQDVKSTFDKSVDFTTYKKYTWGSNYLLTQQPKDVQEHINMAIVDSINRNLQARGFVEDDKSPDFRVTYEAGGQSRPMWARNARCTLQTWWAITGATSAESLLTFGLPVSRKSRSR